MIHSTGSKTIKLSIPTKVLDKVDKLFSQQTKQKSYYEFLTTVLIRAINQSMDKVNDRDNEIAALLKRSMNIKEADNE